MNGFFAVVAAVALSAPATHLSVQLWTGNDLAATSGQAVKYRLEVRGKPGSTIRLHAANVARGWLAAFCTAQYCSPGHVETRLPSSGETLFQFELIRESDGAPKRSGATILSDDGASVTIR